MWCALTVIASGQCEGEVMNQMPSNYQNRSSKKPKPKKAVSSSSQVTRKEQTPGERMAGYEREHRHPSGAAWKRIVANVISHYNGICHLPLRTSWRATGRPRSSVR